MKNEIFENSPDAVKYITKFTLEFRDSVQRNAYFYANGKNQVAVRVRMTVTDDKHNVIKLTEGEIINHLKIYTGNDTEKNYSTGAGDFVMAIKYGPSPETEVTNKMEENEDESAVNIFISESSETNFKIYAKATFLQALQSTKDQSQLEMTAVTPLDYSSPDNWIVPSRGKDDWALETVGEVSVWHVNVDIVPHHDTRGSSQHGKIVIKSRHFVDQGIKLHKWKVFDGTGDQGDFVTGWVGDVTYGRASAVVNWAGD